MAPQTSRIIGSTMRQPAVTRTCRCAALALLLVLAPLPALAAEPPHGAPVRNGQHDFDFEIGSWKTHVARLQHPLSGSRSWVEYDGKSIVRPLWGGKANLVELGVSGPAGRIEGASLRLYNPASGQWSLNFANSTSGVLGVPTVGEFRNGRGEFYDQESLGERTILVRFVIEQLSQDTCRFEQAFSGDGGHTWEVNWIATDTRSREAPAS